jgi:hypothetical protein
MVPWTHDSDDIQVLPEYTYHCCKKLMLDFGRGIVQRERHDSFKEVQITIIMNQDRVSGASINFF